MVRNYKILKITKIICFIVCLCFFFVAFLSVWFDKAVCFHYCLATFCHELCHEIGNYPLTAAAGTFQTETDKTIRNLSTQDAPLVHPQHKCSIKL